jgi:hypothetical protein
VIRWKREAAIRYSSKQATFPLSIQKEIWPQFKLHFSSPLITRAMTASTSNSTSKLELTEETSVYHCNALKRHKKLKMWKLLRRATFYDATNTLLETAAHADQCYYKRCQAQYCYVTVRASQPSYK